MDTASAMSKPSLSTQLFVSIIALFLAFAGAFLLYQARREKAFKIALLNRQLQDYNAHLGEALGYTPLTEESVEKYLLAHPLEDLRVTILDPHGYVLFDNQTKAYPNLSDHRERKEIADALRTGSGYDLDRLSTTVEKEYFYSATFIPSQDLVIRSALPYDGSLPQALRADTSFLWYAAALMLLLIGVLYWYSRHTGSRIRARQDIESYALQKELTQNIAHELKTPVTGIRGYLETLEAHPEMPRETRERFLGRSLSLTRRLGTLIDDLSTLDALEGRGTQVQFAPLDAAETIRTVIEESEEALREKKMQLDVQLPDAIPLSSDAKLLYSIFRNLMDNAINYAGEGTTISLAAQAENNFWHFCFADNGKGVPPESLPRLYDRFFRTDKGRSRELGGSGLGLSIVKEAIELHGGAIRAESVTPHGLRHRFTLPQK